jgi:hypothetical protein
MQLENFSAELSRKTRKKQQIPTDWFEAFERLLG